MITKSFADIDLATVDLTDLAYFQDGPPHELFARMRAEASPHWNALTDSDEPGFWSFTKFDDIQTISSNPELFSSARGGVFFTATMGAAPVDVLSEVIPPAATPPPAGSPQPPPATGGGGTYVVVRGDTLWAISRRNGTTVDALKAANGLTSDIIYVGQRLVIPGAAGLPPAAPNGSAAYIPGVPVPAGSPLRAIRRIQVTLSTTTARSLPIGPETKEFTMTAGVTPLNLVATDEVTADLAPPAIPASPVVWDTRVCGDKLRLRWRRGRPVDRASVRDRRVLGVEIGTGGLHGRRPRPPRGRGGRAVARRHAATPHRPLRRPAGAARARQGRGVLGAVVPRTRSASRRG